MLALRATRNRAGQDYRGRRKPKRRGGYQGSKMISAHGFGGGNAGYYTDDYRANTGFPQPQYDGQFHSGRGGRGRGGGISPTACFNCNKEGHHAAQCRAPRHG